MSEFVFLIGAGRSGTTLLYKLLALHSEIAVITNYDSKLLAYSPASSVMRFLRHRPELKKAFWFGKGGAAYFRPGLQKVFPYPVEGEPLYRHCGVPLLINPDERIPETVGHCLEHRFSRLRQRHGGAVFLSKRTANNRRLAWLRKVFPGAKFINLMRDGRDVAYSLSTVDWWQEHTVWWASQRAGDMEASGWDRLDICARNWVEEVTALEEGLAEMPEGNLLNLRYEYLLQNPAETMQQLLSFMSLDVEQPLLDILAEMGLKQRAPKWLRAWDETQQRKVYDIERELLARYGYV